MQKPAIPPDETTRIDTLRALNILDSSPEERFDRITRLAKRLFGVPVALISLVDTDRQWFLSSFGFDAKETPRDISFCGHAILNDDILSVPDAALDPRFNDNPLVIGAPNIRFYAGCPISVQNGSKLGTICLIDESPREFNEEDKLLLRDLAHMVEQEVVAVQLATLDELTMISNRRGFEVLSNHALSLCKRMGGNATILFIDLDKFKSINDTFGHAEGDHALQVFSKMLRDVFRDSDVIGRIGGDEFAVLLTMTSVVEAQEVLQRLQEVVSAYNLRATRGYKLEYSHGVAEFNSEQHTSIENLLKEADEKMYKQKKSK
jgi:diguanylate cyclase (GGDEF)-like protein